jgi:hypothetical protein
LAAALGMTLRRNRGPPTRTRVRTLWR